MSAVHSARWYRVASLAPRLVGNLQLRRQQLRGDTWFLLSTKGGGRHLRLNASAWRLAAALDGRQNLQQLWDWALAHQPDPPTQDELLDLLAQLREAGLLQQDLAADTQRLLPHLQKLAKPPRRANLLAWRFSLANPSALLRRLEPLGRLLFSAPAAWLWGAAVVSLLLHAVLHGPALVAHGRQWLATPSYALLAVALYVPVKLLHELAHGLAMQRHGARVSEAGITLMLGVPLPWVNASAANGLPKRRHRVLVGAAGMMAELAIAALALPLWLVLPDGLARDAAFVCLFITGVSTLLFNANPLQRLDGYYIATDWLALPNLAARSRQWWLGRLQKRLLRHADVEPMPLAQGEAPWLAAYAPLAWAYGLLIAALGVAWLGALSWTLGMLAAVLLAWQMGLRPGVGLLQDLRRSALGSADSSRRWRRMAWAGSSALLLLAALPWPLSHVVQGVVWPPEQAQLRAAEAGFIHDLAVRDGQWLPAGALVARLDNPAVTTRAERQQARVTALHAEWLAAMPGNSAGDESASGAHRRSVLSGDPRAGDAQAELAQAEGELAELRQRLAGLEMRTLVAGRIALPQPADLPGRYLKRGELLGHVQSAPNTTPPTTQDTTQDTPQDTATNTGLHTVRLALPEHQAQALLALDRQALHISVRLAASAAQVHPAHLLGPGGGAVLQLPSAALSQRRGGTVVTDPQDPDDLKPLAPVLPLDLQLSLPATLAPRLGERAWVRFDQGWAALGWQLAQALRHEVQARFNPQF